MKHWISRSGKLHTLNSLIPYPSCEYAIIFTNNVMDSGSDDDMKVIGGFHRNWRACIPAIKIDGKMVPRDGKHAYYPFHEEF